MRLEGVVCVCEMFDVKALTVCSGFRKRSTCECQSERTLLQELGALSGTSFTFFEGLNGALKMLNFCDFSP